MELIFISIILLTVFGFIGLVTLGYAITKWEQKKLEDMAKNIQPKSQYNQYKRNSPASDNNYTKDNLAEMNVSQKVNHYLERSIVLVKNQDYKGWFDRTTKIFKKVSSNLELYTKFAWNKIINLVTKDKKKSDHIPPYTDNKEDVDITIDKINEINNKQDNFFVNNQSNDNIINVDNINTESNYNYDQREQPQKEQGMATIDMVSSSDQNASSKKPKDEIYEKIETNILQRLKETGLSHYDIWLELGKHYEKYDEKEKAIEVYSMVMKHAEGKEKDIARDGLIGLS
jgi:hypothetical protein